MKSFREQFIECRQSGVSVDGRFESFKDHPELMPHLPSPETAKAIKEGKFTGLQLLACKKFGGDCNSGNPECRKLRGVEDSK